MLLTIAYAARERMLAAADATSGRWLSRRWITDTAFLRNPNYHGAGDTRDTLDYARMANVVQGAYAVAHRF